MAYLQPVPGGFKVRWREGGRGSPLLASPVYENEAKAQDAADDIAAGLLARRALSESRALGAALPLLEVVHRWAAARVAERGITEQYARKITLLVKALAAEMGWTTFADITPAEVDRWRTTNGGRNARLGASLRAIVRWAEEHLRQPVPAGTWIALRPPRAPRRPRRDLPSAKDLARWQRIADGISKDAGALVHGLATYGWRPIAAARMLVSDFDSRRGKVLLRDLKGTGDDLRHPVLPATRRRLRELAKGRKPTDPLFIDPRSGAGWMDDETGKHGMSEWWREHVEDGRGIYDLKRHAISGMLARGLAPQDVALFTGHRSLSQVLVYARTNEERALVALDMLAVKQAGRRRRRRSSEGAPRVHGLASGGFRRHGGAA